MKFGKIACAAVSAVMLAGCSSYTAITRYDGMVRTDDGEKPIGAIEVSNVGYSLFGCLPIESGHVWQEDGVRLSKNEMSGGMSWFKDECTVDENVKGIKRALKEFPSNRVTNLTTTEDSWSAWSLFIIQRKIVRTICTVLTK